MLDSSLVTPKPAARRSTRFAIRREPVSFGSSPKTLRVRRSSSETSPSVISGPSTSIKPASCPTPRYSVPCPDISRSNRQSPFAHHHQGSANSFLPARQSLRLGPRLVGNPANLAWFGGPFCAVVARCAVSAPSARRQSSPARAPEPSHRPLALQGVSGCPANGSSAAASSKVSIDSLRSLESPGARRQVPS